MTAMWKLKLKLNNAEMRKEDVMETREKGKFEFSLDNRQVGLIVSGLILVLALSFLLGTLFGRNLGQMADSGQPAAVAMADATTAEASELAAMPVEGATAPIPGGTVAPATLSGGTSDRDNLIATLESQKPSLEGPIATSAAVDPAVPAATPAPAAPPRAEPLSAPISTVPPAPKPVLAPDPAPAVTPAPAPKPKAEPKPAPKPAADSAPAQTVKAGAYTIQIASAPSKAEAQAVVNQLRSKNYDAYLIPAALSNGTFYRVRVGHYSSLDQAEKARKVMQSRENSYYDAWITQ